MTLTRLVLTSTAACSVVIGVPVSAQMANAPELASLSSDALVAELTMRYDAALAASQDQSLTSANDSRHLWALEAKVQCAIALGYMKSSTRDEASISKCARAYELMKRPPRPATVQAPPLPTPPTAPPRPDYCLDNGLVTVFFEFNSAEIQPAAVTILDTVAQQTGVCGWSALSVVGHTDQAGSDQYNQGLSRQRADIVAAALRTKIPGPTQIDVDAQGESNPRVPLPDGTRSPENRRVEISVK